MYIQPYIPDPTRDTFLHSYDEELPLAANVVYYVESPDNEALNNAMRQLAQKKAPLFKDTDIQPYPYHFQYLAQSELDEEKLRSELSSKYNKDDVDEIVSGFLHCLSDGKGGTLMARCLPSFSYDGYFTDDHTVCTFPGFNLTPPQAAADKAKWFARETAMRNFYRLTGESYEEYRSEPKHSRHDSGSYGGWSIGFMTRKKTKQEIKEELQENYEALSKWLDEHLQNDDEMAITILDMELKRRQQKGKLTTPLFIKVTDENIYLEVPGKEHRKIHFKRAHIAKMLYIFFLLQIKREAKDPSVPKHIAKVNLDRYKDDLLEIYQSISGNLTADIHSIESVWDKDLGTFDDAISSIRTTFRKIFDTEILKSKGKCYTIEIMGKDKIYGSLYGIQLDADDFELGWPFSKMV